MTKEKVCEICGDSAFMPYWKTVTHFWGEIEEVKICFSCQAKIDRTQA